MTDETMCLHTISFGKDATTKGVQTGPGAMQFTRMPLDMRCDDSPLVKVTIAPCRYQDMVLACWTFISAAPTTKHSYHALSTATDLSWK